MPIRNLINRLPYECECLGRDPEYRGILIKLCFQYRRCNKRRWNDFSMRTYGIGVTQESILPSCKELKHWDLPLIFWRGKMGCNVVLFPPDWWRDLRRTSVNASRAEWHEEALKERLCWRLAEVGPEKIRLGLHCPPLPNPNSICKVPARVQHWDFVSIAREPVFC